MNTLCIDLGSYSVKIIECTLERKQLRILSHQEIVISELSSLLDANATLEEQQREIILGHLGVDNYEGKIMMNLPEKFLTSRFLKLPVPNKKRAEQMVPFQLDEDLPFSIADAIYQSTFTKKPGYFHALVNIVKKERFEAYNKIWSKDKFRPSVMTTGMSLFANYVDQTQLPGSFMILDLGHKTTKGYIFHQGDLVSSHTSSCAGFAIDEMITLNYSIEGIEVRNYKHEHAFFLTADQITEARDDQKEFAILMKEAISPLLTDLKRWEVGFKGQFAVPIQRIYLVGGTSNIRNIDNFLTTETNIQTVQLDIQSQANQRKISLRPTDESILTQTILMGMTQNSSKGFINFLTGNYANTSGINLPLHSFAFVTTRILIILSILFSVSIVENFIIGREDSAVSDQIKKRVKNPTYNIKRNQQKEPEKFTAEILTQLDRNIKELAKEYEYIKDASSINALAPLALLSSTLTSNENIDLVDYSQKGRSIQAMFKATNEHEYKTFVALLGTLGLPDIKIQQMEKDNSVVLQFTENR